MLGSYYVIIHLFVWWLGKWTIILPNGGLLVIYHGKVLKQITKNTKNPSICLQEKGLTIQREWQWILAHLSGKKTHLLKVRLLPHPFLCSVFYKVSGVSQVNCQNFCFKGHIWPIELCYIVHLFICFHQPNKTMEVQPPGQIPFEIQLFCFVFCHRIWRTCQNWKNLHQVSCWILQPYCARATIEPRTQTLLLSIILVG